jgi:hypothetical protein
MGVKLSIWNGLIHLVSVLIFVIYFRWVIYNTIEKRYKIGTYILFLGVFGTLIAYIVKLISIHEFITIWSMFLILLIMRYYYYVKYKIMGFPKGIDKEKTDTKSG